jgi:hypothetical protein
MSGFDTHALGQDLFHTIIRYLKAPGAILTHTLWIKAEILVAAVLSDSKVALLVVSDVTVLSLGN